MPNEYKCQNNTCGNYYKWEVPHLLATCVYVYLHIHIVDFSHRESDGGTKDSGSNFSTQHYPLYRKAQYPSAAHAAFYRAARGGIDLTLSPSL